VLIVDDVISAGTSVRESVELIPGIECVAQRCCDCARPDGTWQRAASAVQEVKKMHAISVTSIIDLNDLVEYFTA